MNLQASSVLGVGGGEASRLQAEMLQLDLIDATGETPAEEGKALEPIKKEPPPVTMDTYRPKRPTTLNLFPQVPRTQVSLRGRGGCSSVDWGPPSVARANGCFVRPSGREG